MAMFKRFSLGVAAMALGAAMRTVSEDFPSFGGRPTPTFLTTRERDGLGRRIEPKSHPNHNARRKSLERVAFVKKVMSTHRDLPDGTRQVDPRDAKYLHSYARNMRAWKELAA